MSQALENIIADMSLADLARMSGRSVAEIAAFVLAGTGTSHATSNGATTRKTNGTRADKRIVSKSSAATEHLAENILQALSRSDAPLRSMDLEKIVGGTTETRRYALQQLLQANQIRKSGVAKGTRYAIR